MGEWTWRRFRGAAGGWRGRFAVAVAVVLAPASLLSSQSMEGAPIAHVRTNSAVSQHGSQPVRSAAVLCPVAGVAREALRDSFADARSGGRRHCAIDIPAPRDTSVLAAVDGTIADLGENRLGGLVIYQFDRARRLAYYYAHLERYAPGLVEGMVVHQGDLIGYVGSSGNAPPQAPHLHFAVYELRDHRWLGQPINPYPLLVTSP